MASKLTFTIVFAVVLGCGLAAACSDGTSCLRHTDCISGESCHSGTCMAGKASNPKPKPDAGNGEFDGSSVNDSSPE
ncbi:MAG TPA: hypothetical protein VI072_11810 [Polyangiaceae bacterium]